MRKHITHKTSTRLPFWRWINFLHRTWAWSWNAMFFFGVTTLCVAALDIVILVSVSTFYHSRPLIDQLLTANSTSTGVICISCDLQVVIPWCSPLSFRALFCSHPFMAQLELNAVNVSLLQLCLITIFICLTFQ